MKIFTSMNFLRRLDSNFNKTEENKMASSKGYLQYILDQLSDLEEITYRAMMGEYILYYRDKVIGVGICLVGLFFLNK